MSVPLAFDGPVAAVAVQTGEVDAAWQPGPRRSLAHAVAFAAAATVAVVVLVDGALLLTVGSVA